MTGVRFYLEFPDVKTRRYSGRGNKGHSGNVFAAFVCNGINPVTGCYDGLGGVHAWPNSPVASTGAGPDHLKSCKRIPERMARRIHPALFERLDDKTI